MGGTMEYLRWRHRNGLDWRPTEHRDPYRTPPDLPDRPLSYYLVLGDLNRFERDVLGVGMGGDDLAARYAEAADTDIATVRKVLRAVFESGWDYGIPPILDLAPPPVADAVDQEDQPLQGTDQWYEQRRLIWNDQAREIVATIRKYEDEHPDDAICLQSVYSAVITAVS